MIERDGKLKELERCALIEEMMLKIYSFLSEGYIRHSLRQAVKYIQRKLTENNKNGK